VDARDVTHMSRAAVIALVDSARVARREGCEFTVVAATSMLRRLRVGLDAFDRELLGLHATDG
jgi:anti-anti-sigma regulatory factor